MVSWIAVTWVTAYRSFVVSCISINASKAVYVPELIPLILVCCGVPVDAILVVVVNISVNDTVVLPIPVEGPPVSPIDTWCILMVTPIPASGVK